MNGAANRFADVKVSRTGRYSLGRDARTGDAYLSIPVANRLADYEEYFRLTRDAFDALVVDEGRAAAFADECRRRLHDDRLILPPGSDRGVAV